MGDRRYGVGSRGRSPSPRRPPPRSRDFGPPPRSRDFSPPPPRSRNFGPPPRARDFSPPPRARDFSPPPRARDFSPPPRSRNFSPSRHRKYSPLHRRTEGYSREAETSRRIEKRGHFDRDFDLRAPGLCENDNRDRDRGVVDGRQYRSPRRIEERDNFDRDGSKRTVRLPDYEGAGKSKYGNGVSVGRSMRSYGEDSYRDGSSFTKFQPDNILDGPRKSDHLRVDDTKVTSSGGERDYYPHSRYSDSGRAGPLSVPEYSDCDKPVPLKYERGERMHSHSYTLHHGGVDDIPISNLSGGDGSSHMPSVASRYLNTDTDKLGYTHFRNELHLERRDGSLHDREDHYFEKKNDGFPYLDGVLGTEERVGEEINQFKNGDSLLASRGYLKRDSDYMVSSSQPRDYVSVSSGILREGFPGYAAKGDLNMPSHVMQRGSILASQPIGFDVYSEKMENMLPRGLGGQLDDTRSASRLYTGLREEKQGDHLFAEFGRSEIGSMSTRLNDAEEDDRDQHVSRTYVSNPTFNECSHKKPMRDDGLSDEYPFSQVQSTPDKLDASRLLHARKLEPDMLGTGSSRFNYGIDGYGSVKNEEHYAEVDGGQWSHVERSDILQSRGYDTSFGRIYDSPRRNPALVDISSVEPSETRLRYKHVRDEILYEQDAGIRISADGHGARMIYNQVNVGDGIDHLKLSHKLKSSKSNYEETWRSLSDMANDHPTSSNFHPRHSFKPCKSDSRGIKNRLGPIPQKLHVSQRLVKKYKPPLKKRLAPAPLKNRAALPWLKNSSSNAKASLQDSDKSPHGHDGGQLEDHLPPAKPEPPEKSDDFKQLVQSAFFKFLKQINETPTKRKNYMEHGKAGSLKCIVCGSNSDEFADTESLAMHAFTSEKVGLRSQHLGFHKALCVLMGWKSTEQFSSEWRCEVMSNAETSALKEDLIIWPPVVIVYNSTVDNMNPDERVIVSTEKLDMKLRDMGFGSIIKVCNGKPANQSVMLVKFNGTLSGLQEAERFHKSYVESKHGRFELKQLKSANVMSSGGSKVISAERDEDFLYGHLGIAEDLDKLDFDTKKRCVLRSKKDILSIANVRL